MSYFYPHVGTAADLRGSSTGATGSVKRRAMVGVLDSLLNNSGGQASQAKQAHLGVLRGIRAFDRAGDLRDDPFLLRRVCGG